MLPTLLPTLAALLLPALASHPPPAPPAIALRPLGLYLQQRSDAANAIPGRRYGVGRSDYPHAKPAAASTDNWMFPSATGVTKNPAATLHLSAGSKGTPRSRVGTGPEQGDARAEAVSGAKKSKPADDRFSQVFAEDNAVLESPKVSHCVWAIVACCSPGSKSVRYGCFEQLGCHGAFWDTSPCDRHITHSAIQAALKFYE